MINPEISGVNNQAFRGINGKPHPVHGAVTNPYKLNLKGRNLYFPTWKYLIELCIVKGIKLFELVFHHTQCKCGAVNRHGDIF